MDGERQPGIAAVGQNALLAAEQPLLVAFGEHTEQELQVRSLLCYVALKLVAAVAVLVPLALEADAWVGVVVGGEREISSFVVQ